VGLGAFGNTGCVFAHADVAPVVRAVFDTIPVPAYGFEQFGRGIVACGYAGYVVGVFFLRFINFSRSQILPFTVNEDELPAPDQARLFGAEAFTLDTPALQPPVGLLPSGVMFTGKKTPAVV